MLGLLGVSVFSALTWALWMIFKRLFIRSPLDNIPGPPSRSFLKGVFPQIFNLDGWEFHKEIAEKYGSVIKIKALFGENQLYVFDPKAMHHIIVKDQHVYEETSGFIQGNQLMFGPGLLSTLGEQHRKQRKMLNPVFSISHMREMMPTFYNVSYKLRDALARKVEDGPQEVDVLAWMTRAALELIAQSALGYSFDPLTEDMIPHPYSRSAQQLVPVSFKMIFSRIYFLPTLVKLGPSRFRRLMVDFSPWKSVRDLRDIVDTLHNTSVEIYEAKKQALEEGDEAAANKVRHAKDMLSILMKANMNASNEDVLTKEELLGQVSTLTFAATDTTSTALSRTLHLLSINQDVQRCLRQETVEAKQRYGELSYDLLVSLPYLDAVCRETLRLYAPVSTVTRTTRQDIVLPLANPIKGLDGQDMHEIAIPNNTNVVVGLLAANVNPQIWGRDSYEWKPERWLAPLPETVAAAHLPGIYSHLMTFLGGGRACIGFKFSQLEMKVVLSLLIESFQFSLPEKDITWQMTPIATPTVVGSSLSQLPLILRLADPVC